LRERIRAIPASWKLGSAVTLAILVVFGAWFFFFRQAAAPIVPPPPPARPSIGKVIPYPDYVQAVSDALTDVRAALNAGGDDRKAAITRAVADLNRVEGASIVRTGGAPPLAQADNTLALAALQTDEPDLVAIESSLAILSASLASPHAAVNGTLPGDQASTALASVLADPLYDYTKSESPLQALIRWLSDLTGTGDPNEVLARLLLALLVGVIVGSLLFLLLQRWVKSTWARLAISATAGLLTAVVFYIATDHLNLFFEMIALAGLVVAAVAAGLFIAGLNRASAPSSPRSISDLEVVLGMGAREARSRAAASAGQGDYRAAIRYRCLAVLLALDEAGMLLFDRSTTNREYLFRAPAPIHDDLQPLLDRFEAIWYGNSPTDAAEWAAYDARAAAIETHIAAQKPPKAA
jgi:hypothetical protein